MTIKYMADGDGGAGGGGGTTAPPDWRASIPEDLRAEPALKDIKDIGSLAKSYVHAQRLVGADKLERPSEKWDQAKWGEFYNAIGRPASPDRYSFKAEGLPEGMKVDDAKLADARTALHAAGLTDKQAGAVMKYYFDSIGKDAASYKSNQQSIQAKALETLQQEYGDQTQVKLDVAKSVLKKFGTPEMAAQLEATGLGNDPGFIKMFAKIGELMLDDKALGGGNNLILTDTSAAQREIEKLKSDKDFIFDLGDRQRPGHKQALSKWEELHKLAYPTPKES